MQHLRADECSQPSDRRRSEAPAFHAARFVNLLAHLDVDTTGPLDFVPAKSVLKAKSSERPQQRRRHPQV
jgi:hypothetical protein